MLLSVLPDIWACAPQELLPIMPPKQQWLWVAGSGPQVSKLLLSLRARLRSSSHTVPGSTRAQRSRVFTSSTPCMYFDQSSTMATLQHWPARLVPPPRDRTGAPYLRQAATVCTTSSLDLGATTPMGTCR